jgi:hypothetical protein
MNIIYEKAFDWNEWFIIISLIVSNILVWTVPRIFSKTEGTAYYLYGIVAVMFYDHTVSVRPWDFYDVNDSSSYQLMDFLYYVMNGPYGYFFMYLYVKFKIKGHKNFFYILIWSAIGLLIEWIGVKIGLFHYDKGYKMYWSFPIYLIMQSILVILFHIIKREDCLRKR